MTFTHKIESKLRKEPVAQNILTLKLSQQLCPVRKALRRSFVLYIPDQEMDKFYGPEYLISAAQHYHLLSSINQ